MRSTSALSLVLALLLTLHLTLTLLLLCLSLCVYLPTLLLLYLYLLLHLFLLLSLLLSLFTLPLYSPFLLSLFTLPLASIVGTLDPLERMLYILRASLQALHLKKSKESVQRKARQYWVPHAPLEFSVRQRKYFSLLLIISSSAEDPQFEHLAEIQPSPTPFASHLPGTRLPHAIQDACDAPRVDLVLTYVRQLTHDSTSAGPMPQPESPPTSAHAPHPSAAPPRLSRPAGPSPHDMGTPPPFHISAPTPH